MIDSNYTLPLIVTLMGVLVAVAVLVAVWGLSIGLPQTSRLCMEGWHSALPYRSDVGPQDHLCTRPHGHTGPCQCACGAPGGHRR